jgi:hypothetical protein
MMIGKMGDAVYRERPTAKLSTVDFQTATLIITSTTPATPLHGSAPGGLLFCGAGK